MAKKAPLCGLCLIFWSYGSAASAAGLGLLSRQNLTGFRAVVGVQVDRPEKIICPTDQDQARRDQDAEDSDQSILTVPVGLRWTHNIREFFWGAQVSYDIGDTGRDKACHRPFFDGLITEHLPTQASLKKRNRVESRIFFGTRFFRPFAGVQAYRGARILTGSNLATRRITKTVVVPHYGFEWDPLGTEQFVFYLSVSQSRFNMRPHNFSTATLEDHNPAEVVVAGGMQIQIRAGS